VGPFRSGALLVLTVLSLGGCAEQEQPWRLLLREGRPAQVRPADGLLERADLQDLVERQVRREAAGLIRALADPDPTVRARAAYALGSVQSPEAGPALLSALTDASPAVRRDAAFALGQLGDARVGPALVERLRHEEDAAVRHRLLEAVGKVGGSDALQALEALEVRRRERGDLALALARMGIRGVHSEVSLRRLVDGLTDADPEVRLSSAYYFGRRSDPDPWRRYREEVRAAIDGYSLRDPAGRYLLQGLRRLRSQLDNPRLVRWLTESPDWRARAQAARLLAGWENEFEPRRALLAALNDGSRHVAQNAAETLVNSPPLAGQAAQLRGWADAHPDDWRVVGRLLPGIMPWDPDYVFRYLERFDPVEQEGAWILGLRALSSLGGERAVRTLSEAVAEGAPLLAQEALRSLARRWEQDRVEPATHAFYWETFSRAVASGDVARVSIAAARLADPAFRSFGNVERLIEAYESMEAPEDADAMAALLGALGLSGDTVRARPVLERALDHPVAAVRQAAGRALSTLMETPVRVARVDSPSDAPALDWAELAALGRYPTLVFDTDRGRMAFALDTEAAPQTVQTLARFAREGRYDGVPFHRVVPDFVIQGGDFERGDGFGGPGFSIRSELTEVPFLRGVLGMASAGKDTEGSQFFVTHSIQPHLDGSYTAFGWLIEGGDVLDAIQQWDRVRRAWVVADAR